MKYRFAEMIWYETKAAAEQGPSRRPPRCDV